MEKPTPGPLAGLTERVIGSAIEVHRSLGTGLLESAYQACLSAELDAAGIAHEREVPLPVSYRGLRLDCGYRLDFVVERSLVLEIKAIERVLPVHQAQLVSYLRLSRLPVGLLINFHVPVLHEGVTRRVLTL